VQRARRADVAVVRIARQEAVGGRVIEPGAQIVQVQARVVLLAVIERSQIVRDPVLAGEP
jgi:5,10-methylene-tetrahydrofolate dehydrogenase/methenyl tetrahydrofolate cyclohydrolase